MMRISGLKTHKKKKKNRQANEVCAIFVFVPERKQWSRECEGQVVAVAVVQMEDIDSEAVVINSF